MIVKRAAQAGAAALVTIGTTTLAVSASAHHADRGSSDTIRLGWT